MPIIAANHRNGRVLSSCYGLGDSLAVLKRHAPNANLTPAFSMEADQERRTMTQVRDWLGQITRA